jgi:hypothetical protein
MGRFHTEWVTPANNRDPYAWMCVCLSGGWPDIQSIGLPVVLDATVIMIQ